MFDGGCQFFSRTGNDGSLALQYLKRCGGTGMTVSDEEVFTGQSHLLQREGIYCEPAGAAALAGFRKAAASGIIGRDQVSVCLVTGHGSKDPDAIERVASLNRERLIDAGDLANEFRYLSAK
jgi:threonine synthase